MSTSTATVVYSTTTGQAPTGTLVDALANLGPGFDPTGVGSAAFDLDDAAYDPFCYICSRCTDHVGEHPGLVEAGLASYGLDGSVRKTAAWNPEEAARIAEAEFQAYSANLHGPSVYDDIDADDLDA